MSSDSKRFAVVIQVVTLLLFFLSACQLSFLAVPYFHINRFFSAFAADGNVALINEAFVLSLKMKVAFSGVLCFCLALYAYRKQETLSRLYWDYTFILAQEFKNSRLQFVSQVRWFEWLALLIIFSFGVLIRFNYLFQAVRYDESFTYLTYASKPFFILISNYSEPNNHILHTILVKLTTDIFGSDIWAIRLPGFIFGALLPLMVFWLARLAYSTREALLAAALCAGNSYLIEYSTIGRGYTLLCFFSLLVFGAAYSLRKDDKNPLAWFTILLAGALGFYTIPIMVYPLAGVFLYLFVFLVVFGEGRKRNFLAIVSCGLSVSALGLLLYTPIFIVSGFEIVFANEFVKPHSIDFVLQRMPDSIFETLILWFREISAIGAGILVFVLILFFTRDRRLIFLILSLLFTSAALVLIQRVVPFERVWLFMLPLFLIAAAKGLVIFLEILSIPRLRDLSAGLSIVICLLLSSFVFFGSGVRSSRETGVFPGASELLTTLAKEIHADDVIVAAPPSDFPLKYYAHLAGVPLRHFDVAAVARQGTGRELYVVNKLYERTPMRAVKNYNLKLDNPHFSIEKRLSTKTHTVFVRKLP